MEEPVGDLDSSEHSKEREPRPTESDGKGRFCPTLLSPLCYERSDGVMSWVGNRVIGGSQRE